MTTTSSATSTSFGAFAIWGSTSTGSGCGCTCPTPSTGNPTNAGTTMVGGKVCYENDDYRITMGDDNTVTIHNKNTGETYEAWGDPHMKIDGQQAFDFWGTTTLQLDDGTKVTIETTPWANDPNATLSSKVTITNGDYGVQVTGVDTNQVGDLKFEETENFGGLLDAVVADGNLLHENPVGTGFLGVDASGRLHRVDQQYINQTDLKKGGSLQAQYADAFKQMIGLLAVAFIGGFLAGRGDGAGNDGRVTIPRPPRDTEGDGNAFVMVMSRSNQNLSWFVAGATWNT